MATALLFRLWSGKIQFQVGLFRFQVVSALKFGYQGICLGIIFKTVEKVEEG
jgi:hypothetical protein